MAPAENTTTAQQLENRIARLRDLYVDGDFSKAEYQERRLQIEAEIESLEEEKDVEPEEQSTLKAGEVLATLHMEWPNTAKCYRAKMLKIIFDAIWIDSITREIVAVTPSPEFVELLRLDGLEERENGKFYLKKGGPLLGSTD